ncbi:C-signal-like [Ptychodera flava]|uniref:C-signal-like n=1 Tax=Ptychodera flava TaxID=63121 RepID=UPI00396A2307
MTSNALVQGASRGIGLQFCRTLLARNAVVFATCRNPEQANELKGLQQQYGRNINILQLDVTKEGDIQNAAKYVEQNSEGKLDLLINCAGMLHTSGRGETSLRDVSHQALSTTFSTNAFGPVLMAKYFGAMMKKGSGSFGRQPAEKGKQHSSVLVNMSAKVGSITDNALGGWYSYRMSKAALNMATKNLSIELGRGRNKVICVSLHPGTVDTDLSRPYHKGVPKDKLFSTEYSVDCLMKIIDNLDSQQTGKYFSWDGQEMPF